MLAYFYFATNMNVYKVILNDWRTVAMNGLSLKLKIKT